MEEEAARSLIRTVCATVDYSAMNSNSWESSAFVRSRLLLELVRSWNTWGLGRRMDKTV